MTGRSLHRRAEWAVLLAVLALPPSTPFAPNVPHHRPPSVRRDPARLRFSPSDYLLNLTIDPPAGGGEDGDGDSLPPAAQPQPQPVRTEIDGADPPPAPGVVLPLTWNHENLSRNAFRIGLPPHLTTELLTYADRTGITDLYRTLLTTAPYAPGREDTAALRDGSRWMVHRPKAHWRSDMHWVSPADGAVHGEYLRALGRGGFDRVLEGIAGYFGSEGLVAYQLSFIGVSRCERGFIHSDVERTGRSAFNIIIPLILEDSGPELEFLSDDETTSALYKYRPNVASIVGDGALHATAPCDYRTGGGMRMAATVYVGDVTEENVGELLPSLTQMYPPVGDRGHLLERAGCHWKRGDGSRRLPV